MIEQLKMNVGTVCIREVVIADGTETLPELARLMREHHVGDVVLVERRDGKNIPTAMVTDRDIVVSGLATTPERVTELAGRDLVTRPLVTAHEGDTIDDALERMRGEGIRRLPVVDDGGALVGILALDDLLEHYATRLSALVTVIARENKTERDRRS